ncbi:MAG: efflux RND transporter permease subunit, partial [Blastocatellia bacterium]
LNVYLYVIIPKGFFPEEDTGRLSGSIQGAQDISFQEMRKKIDQVVQIIMSDPAVDTVGAFTGGGGGGGGGTTNQGRMFIALKALEERKVSASEVIGRLRRRLSTIPGANTFLTPVQDISVGGRQGSGTYQYTLQSDNLEDLKLWAPKLLTELRKVPLITDLNTDQLDRGLQESLAVDRDTASRLGITAQMIDDTLYDAFGQRQVSTIYTQLNQYHVIMEVAPRYWQSPDTLKDIYITSKTGVQVPLASFCRFAPAPATLQVNHQGQFPAITISFNLIPGAALGDAVQAIESAERGMGMPATIQAGFQGTAQAFQASLANEPILILTALIAVYIVLGILYESYVHPITILSTLPSAGVGALLALMLFHKELTVIALIGIILLIGIVKKNAIMMIDFALDAERNEGKGPEDAIFEACILRFRPIMMTTTAAMFGALPLAVLSGMGSEMRQPLGIAIVGGLLVSQALTLYTTPVIYLYLDRMRLFFLRMLGKGQQGYAQYGD